MRRDTRLAIITWFGGLALILQAMLPLMLAVEFHVAAIEDPYLTATDDAICGAGSAGRPVSDHEDHHGHRHNACRICATLAATQAITTPAQIDLPVPSGLVTIGLDVALAGRPAAFGSRPYQARAPPSEALIS
jgi:hypothetical protein